MSRNYPLIKLPGRDLKSRLKKMKPFMSHEETRYYLNGIYLHYDNFTLTMVATNGHILQEQIFECEVELSEQYDAFDCILPRIAVENLIKIMPSDIESQLTMQVINEGKEIRFDFFENEFVSNLLVGTYPDYKKIMPEGNVTLQSGLNAGYLISALAALGDVAVNICVDKSQGIHKSPHLLTSEASQGMRCIIMPKQCWKSDEEPSEETKKTLYQQD